MKYIQDAYEESYKFLQLRKRRQVNQLVLLNNLQRGDENIASTLLITLFNRILSNLYDDKMQVKFVPTEELDAKKINSFNILAQSDYREMDKAKLDYDWDWDTLFFGRGYMETLHFDKKRKIMKPQVINPLVFGYDPFFEKEQEWRYYWKWITKSYWDIQKMIDKGILKNITSPRDLPTGVDPQLWNYKITRDKAKLAVEPPPESTGGVYQILEYYGYDEQGQKCIFWLDRDLSKVIYKEVLDLRDNKDGTSKWPIIVKEAFREPHSSVVFSIADLLEDKHRARSVLLNLAFIAAKDKANPLYKFIPENIKDISQLYSRQIGQHIPVTDLANSIEPLNTANPMDAGLMAFMQVLNQEANDPVGTGIALSPAKKGKQSATEAAIQQQLNDLAQSLQSKIMQFGEEEFWSHWYHRYKRYTKAGDSKLASIVGVKGMTFEKIELSDIHTKYPPKVMVYSAKEAEYKELVLRRELSQLRGQLTNSWTPDAIRNFDKHVLLPKFLQDPNLIEVLVPKTLDEIRAEEENELLNNEELPTVEPTDNHQQHINVHYQAKNTWAKWVHISWHEEMMRNQKIVNSDVNSKQIEQIETENAPQAMQGKSVDKSNPQMKSDTAPLKDELQKENKKVKT